MSGINVGMSDRADISRLLTQIRDIKGQLDPAEANRAQRIAADGPLVRPGASLSGLSSVRAGSEISDGSAAPPSFGQMLKSAVDSVNDTQMKAGELQRAYELGEESVDLTQVMIQMQKASISFEAMTQVRNKVITAYQDVMNMPI